MIFSGVGQLVHKNLTIVWFLRIDTKPRLKSNFRWIHWNWGKSRALPAEPTIGPTAVHRKTSQVFYCPYKRAICLLAASLKQMSVSYYFRDGEYAVRALTNKDYVKRYIRWYHKSSNIIGLARVSRIQDDFALCCLWQSCQVFKIDRIEEPDS